MTDLERNAFILGLSMSGIPVPIATGGGSGGGIDFLDYADANYHMQVYTNYTVLANDVSYIDYGSLGVY